MLEWHFQASSDATAVLERNFLILCVSVVLGLLSRGMHLNYYCTPTLTIPLEQKAFLLFLSKEAEQKNMFVVAFFFFNLRVEGLH